MQIKLCNQYHEVHFKAVRQEQRSCRRRRNNTVESEDVGKIFESGVAR